MKLTLWRLVQTLGPNLVWRLKPSLDAYWSHPDSTAYWSGASTIKSGLELWQ
jgi:hypothetical protein